MKQHIDSIGTTVSVNDEVRESWQRPLTRPGTVYVDDHSDEHGPAEYTAAEARELAAALIRAADEAEGIAVRQGESQ
ncbi:hypothetical protein [Streptomyces sp. NPDC057748]|uniref:hypothetical protein n=1 Tax=unclassified Streptomyces TaxID=2593676 RepID=UPI0036ACEA9B